MCCLPAEQARCQRWSQMTEAHHKSVLLLKGHAPKSKSFKPARDGEVLQVVVDGLLTIRCQVEVRRSFQSDSHAEAFPDRYKQ